MENDSECNGKQKIALDHAWAWFSLHSTQRLQAVNFFLVAIAFLSAAFITAEKEQLHSLAIGVAALAIIVSFLFYRVERRIRSLIHAAEDALKPLQCNLATSLDIGALQLCQRVDNFKPGEWKYSRVFRYLYLTTGGTFALGLLYAAWVKLNTTPGAPTFNLVIEAVLAAFLVVCGYEMLVDRPQPDVQDRATVLARWLQTILGGICVLAGIGIACHLAFARP